MYIEDLKEGESQNDDDQQRGNRYPSAVVVSDARRVLVGAGARALFYPTLLYNVVRNKIQSEFRWWDRVDEFILLGAVPFPADVPRLKAVGVCGVITLNESYETLVQSSLYHEYNIEHLVIPTTDYLFAPSEVDICQAVDFIHGNASRGKTTYVHCKAGRGRSTTIVLCYLVKYKHMTPEDAYQYVRSIRPRVLLASSQWQAVQDFYTRVKNNTNDFFISSLDGTLGLQAKQELADLDDGSLVLVTASDLDGYDQSHALGVVAKKMPTDLSLICRVQFASQAAVARISGLWLRCHVGPKISEDKMGRSSTNNQLECWC